MFTPFLTHDEPTEVVIRIGNKEIALQFAAGEITNDHDTMVQDFFGPAVTALLTDLFMERELAAIQAAMSP